MTDCREAAARLLRVHHSATPFPHAFDVLQGPGLAVIYLAREGSQHVQYLSCLTNESALLCGRLWLLKYRALRKGLKMENRIKKKC